MTTCTMQRLAHLCQGIYVKRLVLGTATGKQGNTLLKLLGAKPCELPSYLKSHTA